MRKTSFSFAVSSLVVLAALGASRESRAATIVDRSVSVALRPDGSFERHERLRVRLETAEDVEDWSAYPIPLDANRSLGEVRAFAVLPGGRQVKVRRKDRDTLEYSGSYTHSSTRFHLLEFSSLEPGAEIDVDYSVEVEPYYPADEVVLAGDEAIERLAVTVTGGGEDWRWRIDGPSEGFEVEERVGGLTVTGRDLPEADPPDFAPGGAEVYPVLRYAWGPEGSWRGVGAWYTELLESVPRAAEPVRQEARALVAGLEDPRERMEALLGFLRRKVRYVAVEVGIGGYRPSSPEEVLERRWGDCKDKSLLLIDLLREAGIAAYPALIRADRDRRLDVEFPSPAQFNHAIVAVDAAAVDYGAHDPVADGYFFVDPTQERGTASWLHPIDQDQDVLVVRDGTGSLARTPIRPSQEHRKLVVNLRVLPEGQAMGGVGLELGGSVATLFIEQMATAPPERMEEDARRIFASLLPGVTVGEVGWSEKEKDGVPAVDMSASIRMENLVEGRRPPRGGSGGGQQARRSFKLPSFRWTPEPRSLEERDVPLVLRPGTMSLTWNLSLPEGSCLPEAGTQEVANEVGFFAQEISTVPETGRVTVERRVEIRHRWIEPELVAALRELALEEHRTQRRRIRLECE